MQGSCIKSFSVFVLIVFTSCNSNNKFEDERLVFDNRPITHQLDTSLGYCFQMTNSDIEERYELSILGNRLEGNGIRIITKSQQVFNVNIVGQISGVDGGRSNIG